MHLEELLQCIEENRREFMAKRAEKVRSTESAAEVSLRGENGTQDSADNKGGAVPAEVEVGAVTGQ